MISHRLLILLRFRCFSTRPLPISGIPQNPQAHHLFQCNNRIHELGKLGRLEEARHLFDKMTHRDAVSWNSMISAYIENNDIRCAKLLFDAFESKNVRTWTILLSGYAKLGLVNEAETVFLSMPERNVVSWNAMLSGFVQNGDIRKARKLFDEMQERNVSSWNSLITGYCRIGLMREARQLFDGMGERNSVSWMLIISGYVGISEYREAWSVFLMMMRSGVRPDQAILVVGLSTVMGFNSSDLTGSLRTLAIKMGYEGDVVVATAILNAYTRCGSLNDAINLFAVMPVRNEYSWTTMIAAFSQCGRLADAIALYERDSENDLATRTMMMAAYMQNGRTDDARRIFDEIVNPDVIAWNTMVSGYAQNGLLEDAKDTFVQMPVKNGVSWAAMVAGFVQNGNDEEGLKWFSELHRTGIIPSHSSLTSSLLACSNTGNFEMGRQIHTLAIKMRCQTNSYVGNSLVSMYSKCNKMADVFQVFRGMRVRDVASWNSLISGLSENHMLKDARNTFEKMPMRDVVSWTSIISAYVQAGHGETALQMFLDMLSAGVKPKDFTIASLLSACGSLGVVKLGEQFHALICKHGLDSFLCVCNSLINMYFKCGSLHGLYIFEEMSEKDIVSWNAVLVGCGQNGLSKEAIRIFKQMEAAGCLPNDITFTGVLCACSHGGLVDEGWDYFISMSQDYGIAPLLHHYTCMVDLLGRVGHLSEAEVLIQNMPVKADFVIWDALLAAYRIHQNMELGQRVGEQLFQMGIQKYGTYVLLSNTYASQRMWSKVEEIRQLMKYKGVMKEPGISWVQIKNRLHSFLTGENRHEEIEEIHLALNSFYECFKASGYITDMDFVLRDIEEEENENELVYHSEKLAVAYAVMRTPNGAPVHILKNLRICVDCHCFMKFMSNVMQRQIVIRDRNRFHHVQNGSCSCGDYW